MYCSRARRRSTLPTALFGSALLVINDCGYAGHLLEFTHYLGQFIAIPHAGVRGKLPGRQLLHELVQNDAAQATSLDQHRGVERRVFGGIRGLRRQDIWIALTGFGPCDRRKALLDPPVGSSSRTLNASWAVSTL